jgi:hypothetical protein
LRESLVDGTLAGAPGPLADANCFRGPVTG